MTGDRVQLVCEGICNPRRRMIDDEVDNYRKDEGQFAGRSQPVPDDLIAKLRRLDHTPHRMVTPFLATCDHCGHQRRFGKPPGAYTPWTH